MLKRSLKKHYINYIDIFQELLINSDSNRLPNNIFKQIISQNGSILSLKSILD